MPEIAPFRGLRYNPQRYGRDFSRLIAPPYDVLEAEDKAELLARSDRNIVGIDLPHVPPHAAGPPEVYAQAARQLRQWREDGTLVRDDAPAIYVYHQLYDHEGRHFTRRMFLARMRLEAFGTGKVFPHEQTFGGPKEDRLALMRATHCQLSPVFALYSDAEGAVSRLLDAGARPPDVEAELQGVVNRMWVLTDPAMVDGLCSRMADRAVYIADGHHRYGTALNHRNELDAKGELTTDHPARFVLVGLCAMEDPGCVILPTHRVLSDFGDVRPAAILAAMQPGLKTMTADPNITDPLQLVPGDSEHDLGIYVAAGDRLYTGAFTQRAILDQLAGRQSPAWRALDLAYLHRYLIDELVTRQALGGKPPTVHCVKSGPGTIDLARQTKGIALLTRPCTMTQLRAVSEAGDLMPQKSTFFYPKLATGLVIHPFD